jgi:hypothetical protein
VIFKVTNGAHFGHDFSINGHTTRVLKMGQSATLRVTFLETGHYVYKDTVDDTRPVGRRRRLHDHLGDTRTRPVGWVGEGAAAPRSHPTRPYC